MLKVKENNEYKNVDLVYSGETEIEQIYDKNGNLVFDANNEIEDETPISFQGKKSANLKNYRIYGQTVDGESVGDRTGNLFDENYPDIVVSTVKYISLSVENGEYTISTNMPFLGYALLFLLSGAVISGASTKDNGVWLEHNQTVTVSDNFITIGYRIFSNADPRDYSVMLNVGSTPLPYEPYGYKVPVTVEGKNLFDLNTWANTIQSISGDGLISISGSTISITSVNNTDCYTEPYANSQTGVYKIPVKPNTIYTVNWYGSNYRIMIFENGSSNYIYNFFSDKPQSFTTHSDTTFLTLRFGVQPTNPAGTTATISEFIISEGSAALPYEPYRTPVTTPIYLPEQIKKVGDEAEYIDYAEQKQHFVDGTFVDVSLPALPTIAGANTLSVGTEVQPSKVMVKGRIKEVN